MPSCGEGLGRLEGPRHHDSGRHHGEVLAAAAYGALSQRHPHGVLGHGPGGAVEQLVLEHDDRVGVVDRGEQQALGIGRRGRHDDLESRHVGEPCLQALRVLGGGTGARATGARSTIGTTWRRRA